MSENFVPYGVGFLSGATFVMMYKNPKIRRLLRNNQNEQDTVVGVSYLQKSSPCPDEEKNGDEDEPLTVTVPTTSEATYLDMNQPDYVNWPPGAVSMQEEQQQNIYEPIANPDMSAIEYANVIQPEQHIYEPIEYSDMSVTGAVSRQQQHIYEPISPPRTDVEKDILSRLK